MHRLFGKKKEAGPAPSLGDASTSINNRVGAIDEKIKGLDGELIKFKEQLKKAKGPAADNIKRRALQTLKRKKMYESQRDQMAGQAFKYVCVCIYICIYIHIVRESERSNGWTSIQVRFITVFTVIIIIITAPFMIISTFYNHSISFT